MPSNANRSSPAASATASRSATPRVEPEVGHVPVRHPVAALVVADDGRDPPERRAGSAARPGSPSRTPGGSASRCRSAAAVRTRGRRTPGACRRRCGRSGRPAAAWRAAACGECSADTAPDQQCRRAARLRVDRHRQARRCRGFGGRHRVGRVSASLAFPVHTSRARRFPAPSPSTSGDTHVRIHDLPAHGRRRRPRDLPRRRRRRYRERGTGRPLPEPHHRRLRWSTDRSRRSATS